MTLIECATSFYDVLKLINMVAEFVCVLLLHNDWKLHHFLIGLKLSFVNMEIE